MKFLLDTNTFIARLNGSEKVAARLRDLAPSEIILCAPVLAELRFGAELSDKRSANLARVESLGEAFNGASFDASFAEVKASLRRQGIAKSDFDLAIAAIALSTNAILVSDDRALGDGTIPGLRQENWLNPPP